MLTLDTSYSAVLCQRQPFVGSCFASCSTIPGLSALRQARFLLPYKVRFLRVVYRSEYLLE